MKKNIKWHETCKCKWIINKDGMSTNEDLHPKN